MQLITRNFGLIEIDDNDIIDFPEGIPGFESVKKFTILGKVEEETPFHWLQGVDNTDVVFVVIDPRLIKPDYVADVDFSEVEVLGIEDSEKVLMYSIVVVPDDLKKMSANLKAPIIINVDNNKGKQVVMDKGDYPIKYYFMEEIQRIGG